MSTIFCVDGGGGFLCFVSVRVVGVSIVGESGIEDLISKATSTKVIELNFLMFDILVSSYFINCQLFKY